jgi:hypothetical protein
MLKELGYSFKECYFPWKHNANELSFSKLPFIAEKVKKIEDIA